MPFAKTETYTTDYIYALPEGQRAELIDGVVFDMAPSGSTMVSNCSNTTLLVYGNTGL